MRKCRETPWKLLFVCASFGGSYSKKSIFASRRPNHVKHLLSGLYDLLKYNFHSLRSPPGDPRVAHCSHFSVRISPLISFFFPSTGISAMGPQGRSDTALRPDSNLLAPHTSGPRDVPRCGALSLLQKDAALQGGSSRNRCRLNIKLCDVRGASFFTPCLRIRNMLIPFAGLRSCWFVLLYCAPCRPLPRPRRP